MKYQVIDQALGNRLNKLSTDALTVLYRTSLLENESGEAIESMERSYAEGYLDAVRTVLDLIKEAN